jgi:murein DD-endopeptidase MepM/ murein hydrolase activator NlpD
MLTVLGAFAILVALALYVRSPDRTSMVRQWNDGAPLLARPGSTPATGTAQARAARPVASPEVTPASSRGSTAEAASTAQALSAIEDLRSRFLTLPVDGVTPDKLIQGYRDPRGGALHEALDIPAARGTAVMAVEAGHVAKLFTSQKGGLTIYQFDPTERYAYYYAHLDSYAPDLVEGEALRRGQLIGYVGTTGNAPANAPHLHFAIFQLGPEKHWWKGDPVDPFLIWRPDRSRS